MSHEEIRSKNIEHVIQQAIIMFVECGVENMTFTSLAKRVGLNTRSLYRYFDSRDALVKAVFDECIRSTQAKINLLQERESYKLLTGRQQIIEIAKVIFDLAKNESKIQACLHQIEFYVSGHNMEKEYYLFGEHDFAVSKCFRSAFEKGIHDGSVISDYKKEVEYETLAITFRGFINHITMVSCNEKMKSKYNLDGMMKVFLQKLDWSLASSAQNQDSLDLGRN